MPHLRVFFQIFHALIFIFLCANLQGAVKVLVSGRITTRIKIHNGPLISESDSLFLNRKKLNRELDYSIDYLSGSITLNNYLPNADDTLRIYYTPLPDWLGQRYGILAKPTDRIPEIPTQSFRPAEPILASPVSSKMLIKGAKKFSVFSETTGSSQFDQSLELTINGELAPGLLISGSVSDREYYSSYSSINSTISELDKINLKIKSKHFESEIGDLEIYQQSEYGRRDIRQVSGLEVSY